MNVGTGKEVASLKTITRPRRNFCGRMIAIAEALWSRLSYEEYSAQKEARPLQTHDSARFGDVVFALSVASTDCLSYQSRVIQERSCRERSRQLRFLQTSSAHRYRAPAGLAYR